MGSEGFEPPKAVPTDLQSVPFDRSGNCPWKILALTNEEFLTCYSSPATCFHVLWLIDGIIIADASRAVKHFFRSFDSTGELLGELKRTPHSEALIPTKSDQPFPAFCRLSFLKREYMRRDRACLLMVKKILPQSIAPVWIYWYNHERSKKDQRKIKKK